MLPDWEIALRLFVAAGLGSLIGAERERLLWAAGLRTHMLVSVGACLLMIVSAFGFADILGTAHVILDPSRIAAQVVSGIGFLGAGSILMRGDIVRGLTTAASLWTVAAIGLAVGGGLYIAAIAATTIILIILAGIKPLEEWFQSRGQTREIYVKAAHGTLSVNVINEAIGYRSRRITRYVSTPSDDTAFDDISIRLTRLPPAAVTQIAQELKKLSGVSEVVER